MEANSVGDDRGSPERSRHAGQECGGPAEDTGQHGRGWHPIVEPCRWSGHQKCDSNTAHWADRWDASFK